MIDYYDDRMNMVETQLRKRGIKDPLVLDAMQKVPRHEFVPAEHEKNAYLDGPLPIGLGQTISQPYMVAVMSEALKLKQGERVLEIGTGSGYQAAILAEIAGEVYSVERHGVLALRAENSLENLGYANIHIKVGDGTLGWPEEAPFDAIIVTAGAPFVSETLKTQLKDGGRLVIPVGSRWVQELLRITKEGNSFVQEDLLGCVFVPLVGEEGWGEGTLM